MALGGKRPGAGRKKAPHTIETEKIRAFVAQKIAEQIEPLIAAMMDKAIKGDVQAFKELMDRGLGRPAQAVDVTSKGDKLAIILPHEISGKYINTNTK